MEYLNHINTRGRAVLIFPGGMSRSLEYLNNIPQDGLPVIGASSLDYDVAREKYVNWIFLPYIGNPEFDEALQEAIATFDIGGIYSPNPVVWSYLNRRLKEIAPDVRLVNESPASAELSGYRSARVWAQDRLAQPVSIASALAARPPLDEIELASLFRHSELIPGMCDHQKLQALYELARCSPVGDVVEIGSWWGKSAFIFLRLAQCYGIGNLLCVDPWADENLRQADEGGLVDHASAQYSAQEALQVFQMNLLPYSKGDANYLHMPSVAGAAHYRNRPEVQTVTFGKTIYHGRIAILHIDGNHSYENAKADVEAWSDLIVDCGWLVLDDYTWPFGDGPKRVGNEFLTAHKERISTAFVMGGALFIQLIK